MEYAIITINSVFQGDFNAGKYRVEFKKSDSKLKTFELNEISFGQIFEDVAVGLTVIPINRKTSVFKHFPSKTCSILKYSSFEIQVDGHSGELGELCCHMVADAESSNRSFCVKTHDLAQDSSGHRCVNNLQWPLVPLGAAVLRRAETKWSLVGVLKPKSSSSETFIPAWLSNSTFKNLRSAASVGL